MTSQEAFREGVSTLSRHACPDTDPTRETEALLAHVLDTDRTDLITRPERQLTAGQCRTYRALLRRRLDHEPLAHLLGSAVFMGQAFAVSRHTLIPRPATEYLVAATTEICRRTGAETVADIGTGSGCIAVTLARRLPDLRILASDMSRPALTVASRNARCHGVAARVTFLEGDLAAPVLEHRPSIIVANLPYLPSDSLADLPPDITSFEPREALDGGPDGLDPYRRLFRQLRQTPPIPQLHLLLELLPEQVPAISEACQDLAGRVMPIRNDSSLTVGLHLTGR